MAVKKIKLDFSKVEERSGWNTRHMPEGLHEFKVTGVEETEASDGTDMLVYSLQPTNPKYKSRNFPFYCKLQQNQLWKLRDLLVAAGVPVPKRATTIDPNAPVGKLIAAEVADGTGQYAERSEINGTYGLDILDDDGTGSGDDDEELDDEDVDDEEGEEDADLDSMSLPELRTLAKSLGIATAGLKKDDLIDEITDAQADEGDEEADDEDDLDDEDLADEEDDEDFEDDDEEEEPAPAPRRRAAAKPAAKAAPVRRAPAAKAAAPARRVVRR